MHTCSAQASQLTTRRRHVARCSARLCNCPFGAQLRTGRADSQDSSQAECQAPGCRDARCRDASQAALYLQTEEGAVTARRSGRVWPADGGTALQIDCSDYSFYIVVCHCNSELSRCNPSIPVALRFLFGLLFIVLPKFQLLLGTRVSGTFGRVLRLWAAGDTLLRPDWIAPTNLQKIKKE